MLDYIGYRGEEILDKHIIDNSCGNGAFLRAAASRYIREFCKAGIARNHLKEELTFHIHGLDIDENALYHCKEQLDCVYDFNVGFEEDVLYRETVDFYDGYKWDLRNENSLLTDRYNGKMDFVIGNPPYVRVHNLCSTYNDVKKFKFANGGMTDLYLAFFELGFNMLSDNGKLCYITPSSWLNSVAAKNMRDYIASTKNLESLIDLGHYQAFNSATTYTIISVFDKSKHDENFDYYTFDGNNNGTRTRRFVDRITLHDCCIDSNFYVSSKEELHFLRDVKESAPARYVQVKNGFATLADSVFIGDDIPDSNITIRAIKASTGKWHKCLFPYNKTGKLMQPHEALSNNEVKKRFEANKGKLLKGRSDYPTYYEFGRTQAIKDVWKEKVAINTLIRNENDLKIERVQAGEGVYSGLYITTDCNVSCDQIKDILISKDFSAYVSLLRKYKSGGYYTYNSKDVEQFINYKLSKIYKNLCLQTKIF